MFQCSSTLSTQIHKKDILRKVQIESKSIQINIGHHLYECLKQKQLHRFFKFTERQQESMATHNPFSFINYQMNNLTRNFKTDDHFKHFQFLIALIYERDCKKET